MNTYYFNFYNYNNLYNIKSIDVEHEYHNTIKYELYYKNRNMFCSYAALFNNLNYLKYFHENNYSELCFGSLFMQKYFYE